MPKEGFPSSPRGVTPSAHTSTAAGKCFLDMLGVFAEFETDLRRERQLKRRYDLEIPACPTNG